MTNTLLNTGEKGSLLQRSRKLKIILSYSYVKRRISRDEIEHLAEEISKLSVEGAARFLLAATRKM